MKTYLSYADAHKELMVICVNKGVFECQNADFEKVVHKDIFDMAAVVYIGELTPGRMNLTPVTLDMCKEWGVTPEEVYKDAEAKTAHINPFNFESASVVYENAAYNLEKCCEYEAAAEFRKLAEENKELEEEEPVFITNAFHRCVSGIMAMPDRLANLAETLKVKGFYIVPLSLHELLAIPQDLTQEEIEDHRERLRKTNMETKFDLSRPQDVLSCHIFHFDAEKRKLKIAGERYFLKAKVYGAMGHRQKQSFDESHEWDFTDILEGTRNLSIKNSDKTGTNEYTLITIVRDSKEGAYDELNGQISDGYFENARVGRVEIVEEGVWL